MREARGPSKEREQRAPSDDQELLHDREHRSNDPVDEQTGGKDPAVQDRDEGHEDHHAALSAGRGIVLGIGRHHHPALNHLKRRGGESQEAHPESPPVDTEWQAEEDLLLAHVDARDDGVDARQGLVQDAVHIVGRVRAGEWHDLLAENGQHRIRVEVGQSDADDRVHGDEHPHLQQAREAAGGRTDASLLVELLLGLIHGLAIALVAALEFLLHALELGLKTLHALLGGELAGRQLDRRKPDDQRQEHDRDQDIASEHVQPGQQDEEGLEYGREEPTEEAERVGWGGRRQGQGHWRGAGRRRGGQPAGSRRSDRRGGGAGGRPRAGAGRARAGARYYGERDEHDEEPEHEPARPGHGHALSRAHASELGRSHRDSTGGSERFDAFPSSSLETDRIWRSPARCRPNRSAHSDRPTGARRKGGGRA